MLGRVRRRLASGSQARGCRLEPQSMEPCSSLGAGRPIADGKWTPRTLALASLVRVRWQSWGKHCWGTSGPQRGAHRFFIILLGAVRTEVSARPFVINSRQLPVWVRRRPRRISPFPNSPSKRHAPKGSRSMMPSPHPSPPHRSAAGPPPKRRAQTQPKPGKLDKAGDGTCLVFSRCAAGAQRRQSHRPTPSVPVVASLAVACLRVQEEH